MREVACKLRPAGKNGDSGSAAGKKVKNAKKNSEKEGSRRKKVGKCGKKI